jgi:hypothetical protein
LVTAVNGTMVVDQDRAHSQEIVNAMLRSGQAIITIVRRRSDTRAWIYVPSIGLRYYIGVSAVSD